MLNEAFEATEVEQNSFQTHLWTNSFTDYQKNWFLILVSRAKFKMGKSSTITLLVVGIIFHPYTLRQGHFSPWPCPASCWLSGEAMEARGHVSLLTSWFFLPSYHVNTLSDNLEFFLRYFPDVIFCLFCFVHDFFVLPWKGISVYLTQECQTQG